MGDVPEITDRSDNRRLSEARQPRSASKRLLIAGMLVGCIGLTYAQFGDLWSLEGLAVYESQLRQYQQEHPVGVYAIAALAYTVVTGLSLPGAAALTLLYAWYFGFTRSVALVSFASTAGATFAFLLSRYFVGHAVQLRFGDRLAEFNEAWRRDGAFYLFQLRLIPVVPFFVINAVMGLTPIRAFTFWWVSQLGMLPATVIYSYVGSRVPSLVTLAERGLQAVFTFAQVAQILLALTLLGIVPLVVRVAFRRLSR